MNLKKSYLYALPLVIVVSIVLLIWFLPLTLWYLASVLISMINYALLINIENYHQVNQKNVLLTLLIRYLIYAGLLFLIVYLARPQANFIGIMIVTAIGISTMKLAAVANKLIHKEGK